MNDFNNHQSNGFNQHESNGFNQYHNGNDNDYYDGVGNQPNYSDQTMIRPFYEEVWFIVIMLILFWPAGLMCALWRFLHDKEIKAFDPNQTTPPLYHGEGQDEAVGEDGAPAGEGQRPKQRNVSNVSAKRSCRTWKIWGWILIVLGVCMMISVTSETTTFGIIRTLATGVGLGIAGAILLLSAKKTAPAILRLQQ